MTYNKIFLLFILITSGITGCSSLPCSMGCISQNKSTYDGTNELLMTPSFIYRSNKGISGSDMRVGLYWSSALPSNNIVLIVLPHKDKPLENGSTINFNVNGSFRSFRSITKDKIVNLKPSTEAATYFNPRVIEGMNVLYYVVNKSFINEIISAKDVRVRIDLKNTYLEGIFSHDSGAAAKQKFSKFMARLHNIKS